MPRQPRASRTVDSRGINTRKANSAATPRDKFARDLDFPAHLIPPGMTYSWVRLSALNEADHTNWQRKIGKGWKAVPRERHADLFPLLNVPGLSDPRYDSIIVKGGLLLCERPTVDVEEDRDAQAQETQEQIEGVDWDNRQDEALKGVPKINESSRVQVERSVASFKTDED